MINNKGNTYWTRLDNGLRVIVEEMDWLPSVSLDFALPAGVMTDPEGYHGAAVVLSDWLERGAGTRTSREFTDAFQDLGVRRGGGTGRETSDFSASLLADALPATLQLYADMVQAPRLEAETFELARNSMLQELASLDDEPVQRLFITLRRNYFNSSHGRSSYGTEAGLKALTPELVRQSYQQHICPDGAILAIAGGVKVDKVLARVEETFANWQGQRQPLPDVEVQKSSYKHIDADTAQTQIGVAYAGIAPEAAHYYHHQLAINVLSGGMAARLFTEVREKRGLVYSVMAGSRTVKHFGYTFAYAGTTTERAQETLEVLLAELRKLSQGVTAEELERARTGMLSSLVMQGESSNARAGSLARSAFLRGQPRTLAEVKAGIMAVSLEAVNAYLATIPKREFTILTLGREALDVEALDMVSSP